MEIAKCNSNPEDTPFVVITFSVYLVVISVIKLLKPFNANFE